jgi:cyclohexyl-isocyanide hydratase
MHLIWKRIEPIPTDSVLTLTPTVTFAGCPRLDVICVPGGAGTDDMVNDDEVLTFLRRQAESAGYITSVCTGSLVLGAAGLLRGHRAATHWSARDLLASFGAIPSEERVCVDGNRITGGGVTAGIDFGLRLAAALHGEELAQRIQLQMEYAPDPPFRAGSPATAPKNVVEAVRHAAEPLIRERAEVCERVAKKLERAA